MGIYVLPRKLKNILGEQQYNKIRKDLSCEKTRLKQNGYHPKVYYSLNEKKYEGACFSDIFGDRKLAKGDILKIDLFYHDQKKLKTRYTNINKYFSHLSTLYKGIDIKCKIDTIGKNAENKLVAYIIAKQEYPNVVIRDICSRVRFLFEGDFNTHMDKCLSKKDFKLSDIEESIGNEHAYHVQIGHWLFTNNKSSNIINYENYEENILEAKTNQLQEAIETVKIKKDEEL